MNGDKMKNLTYEKAVKRLEDIVLQFETGELNLDESIKLFEEGTQLTAFCMNALNSAKQKVITLNDILKEEGRI